MSPTGCSSSNSPWLLWPYTLVSGNKEAFDRLVGIGWVDDPCIPKFTGLRQLYGLAGERRRSREVVLFENKDVSARIPPILGPNRARTRT